MNRYKFVVGYGQKYLDKREKKGRVDTSNAVEGQGYSAFSRQALSFQFRLDEPLVRSLSNCLSFKLRCFSRIVQVQ